MPWVGSAWCEREHKMKTIVAGIAVSLTVGLSGSLANASTLDVVKDRGELKCGVHSGSAGFAEQSDDGRWVGFDVDFCRAIAAAVLGDGEKVQFVPLSSKNRFTALTSGEIDVLIRKTTGTATREAKLGVDFTTPTFYDGQGFLIRKDLDVTSVLELDGASVCVSPGTTSEKNLNDYFVSNDMSYQVVVIEKAAEITKAYSTGRCDVMTNDRTGLAARKLGLKNPDEHMLLPEIISKEPLGPYVVKGDAQWRDIVSYVVYGLETAEEAGITKSNVEELATTSESPEIRRVLGVDGTIGKDFGVSNDWILNAVKATGNYGEIFEANLGEGTRMNLERGLNQPWTEGGLFYPIPFR